MHNRRVHLITEVSLCRRCGEIVSSHRVLCNVCRQSAIVSEQSLFWIEDQLRHVEGLLRLVVQLLDDGDGMAVVVGRRKGPSGNGG